ncbi:MAG TPA: helicase HerA-like domain-containing protein [Usitatibacter sp.]|nr:helicase HerA-like domain-containing protein [Usitatibacter sp.]
MPSPLRVAKSKSSDLVLLPAMANRHGLITGATGTGKTVTLQTIAERFSEIGVPVFMADVKGDLAGMAAPGGGNAKVEARVKELGLADFGYRAAPVLFWDVFGEKGHALRATISEMGPLLLSRVLDLNEVQAGVLAAVFRIADEAGLLLLDLKDLRAILQFAGDNAAQFRTQYGNISTASVGAIQRGLLALDSQGGEKLFGEPALDLADLMQADGGRGVVSILAADRLLTSPRVYSTLLLWLLAELYENLPEVGDPEKPKLVFFFDEAHLLFDDAPKELLDRIEQVVRLVRSKGVGVYFVTQNPLDVPQAVLAQLGNRVQHALRAYTPAEQQAVKAAATAFRANPKIDTEKAIGELAVGEALISFLDEKGRPNVVERALVIPPRSRLGPLADAERRKVIEGSLVAGHYERSVDRESAYEQLKARTQRKTQEAATSGGWGSILDSLGIPGTSGAGSARGREGALEAATKSAARAIGSEVGRRIIRGVLGSILGERR